MELQSEKEQLEEQLSKLRDDVNTHKTQARSFEQLLAEQSRNLKKINDEKADVEQQMRAELDAQAKLATLYKDSAESASRRCSQLQSEVDALRELNKATEEALDGEREAHRSTSAEFAKVRDLSTTSASIHVLSPPSTPSHSSIPEIAHRQINNTIENGNRDDMRKELLNTVAQYEDTIKLLLQERSERRRLAANLNQILQELQAKAPVIDNQRKEYEKMKTSYASLAVNLDASVQKYNLQSVELERVSAENSRLKVDIAGLNTQLQVLLKESLGRSQTPIEDPADLCVGEEVIPTRLLTYRNVEELQTKNFELMRTVRSLTDQVKGQSREFEDTRLENAMKELSQLRAARANHEEVVRALLAQRTAIQRLNMIPPTSSERQPPPNTRDESVSVSENESAKLYSELQEEFEQYKKEKRITEEELQKQLTDARQTATTARIELSKIQSEMALLTERHKMAVASLDASTKDNALLQQKAQESNSLLVSHQQTIGGLRASNAQLDERVKNIQMSLELAREELKLIKETNNRLVEEKQSLMVDRGRAQALVDQVQSLSLAKDAAAQALRERLESELNMLRMDWTQNKKLLEEAQRVSRDLSSSLEGQLRELRTAVAERDKELKGVREESVRRAMSEEALKQQVSALKTSLESSESRLNTVLHTAAAQHDTGSGVSSLTLELELARADLVSANEALAQERENVVRYKSLASDCEADLKVITRYSTW